MERIWFQHGLLAVSGSVNSPGDIRLVKARTLSITVRETCGSSVDANTTVYLYYSPDGSNWDTQAYTSFEITYSAGATVQRTFIIDTPEHGNIKAKITNGSSADTLSDIKVWYSIGSWELPGGASKGHMGTLSSED